MKRRVLMILTAAALAAGTSFAGIVGSTDPTQFTNTVDWCQLGCPGNVGTTFSIAGWTAMQGDTGEVGLTLPNFQGPTSDNFVLIQQANNWNGNFAPGMGGIWTNGAAFGGANNGGDDITMFIDNGTRGVGAYIQDDAFGAFTATISLFDINDVLLGQFSAAGNSNSNGDGSALFIGAFDTTPDIFQVIFDVQGVNDIPGDAPDFAIGQAGLYLPAQTGTPEPGTVLLMVPALLGLAAFGRKKIMNTRGNN
jgi:hypothetical protein